MSLGKVLGGALKSVEAAVSSAEKKAVQVEHTVASKVSTLEQTVAAKVSKAWHSETVTSVVDPIRASVDSFERAISHKPQPAEPALVHGDGATVHYQHETGPLMDTPAASDVRQGGAGDCYFLSAMASVADTHPELIEKAITANPDGTYTVAFHVPPGFDALKAFGPAGGLVEGELAGLAHRVGFNPKDQIVKVTVDGDFPTRANGTSAYAHPSLTNELWPQVMEKAYAKLWGSYDATGTGGLPATALYALTGKTSQTHGLGTGLNTLGFKVQSTRLDAQKLEGAFNTIKAAAAQKKPMEAATYASDNTSEALPNIINGHAYSLLGVSEHDGKRFVVLRNPWGHTEPGHDGKDDGRFELPLEDFGRQFLSYTVGDA
jgi:hypothetical protein